MIWFSPLREMQSQILRHLIYFIKYFSATKSFIKWPKELLHNASKPLCWASNKPKCIIFSRTLMASFRDICNGGIVMQLLILLSASRFTTEDTRILVKRKKTHYFEGASSPPNLFLYFSISCYEHLRHYNFNPELSPVQSRS